ncbi:MAG: YybS family protein [Treponema sp.]|nr:YybS family protein [Treponema sp.]MCL2236994.1 YybS family protein [Treponema sp.]
MMPEEEDRFAEKEKAKTVNIVVSDDLLQDGKNPPGSQLTRASLMTILICTSLSVIFLRVGILYLFFLAPLGFAVIATGSIWHTFIIASVTNVVLSLFIISSAEVTVSVWSFLLLITALFLAFVWLVGSKNFRTLYRLIIASVAGAAAFLIEFFNRDSVFYNSFLETANLFSQTFLMSQETEIAAVNPIFREMTDPQDTMKMISRFLLRGGALLSILALLFINRHLAFSLVRFVKRQRNGRSLNDFYAPQNTVWFFIGALVTIMMSGSLRVEIMEILAWNVFVVCIVIFIAQGFAVLSNFLERRGTGFKIGITVLIIALLLSPIMLVVFGALLILGVLENWIPFRLKKKESI